MYRRPSVSSDIPVSGVETTALSKHIVMILVLYGRRRSARLSRAQIELRQFRRPSALTQIAKREKGDVVGLIGSRLKGLDRRDQRFGDIIGRRLGRQRAQGFEEPA